MLSFIQSGYNLNILEFKNFSILENIKNSKCYNLNILEFKIEAMKTEEKRISVII